MNRLVGKKAPDFKMTAVSGDGKEFLEKELKDYKGRWLVMFFYPLDFTFVCPTEITGFSDRYEDFHKAGAELLAVSTDSQYSHQAWIRDGLGKINFPIAADKTARVSSDYGVLLEDEGIALRGLFIIDPEQVVRYSVIHDLNIGRNTEETLRVLKALQSDGLCGADWQVGDEHLQTAEASEASNKKAAEINGGNVEETGMKNTGEQVKIYTMPDCSYCKKVKEFFRENGIAYEEINLQVSSEGQQFMEERGYRALPVTVIGKTEISGYNMDEIKDALR